MKVLQVSSGLGVGGAERVVLHLSSWLRDRGMQVMVLNLYRKEADLTQLFEQAGVFVKNVWRLPIRLPVGIIRCIASFRPDIVHCHNTAWRKTAAACRWAKVPCVWTMHGYHETWLNQSRSWTLRAARQTQFLIAVDISGQELLRREFASMQEKILYVPNGIPDAYLSVLSPVQWDVALPEEAQIVGMVSRIEEPKDPFTLVEAIVRVKKQAPQVHLLFIGTGKDEEQLRRQIQDLSAQTYVHLLGLRNDVAQILQHLDLFVLSSRSEGQSIALLEAMSAARPIVATDVGGNSLLLDGGRCGILVPPRDPHALAEAILELLTNREKAQELARNARQRFLEHFTIDAMGKRYLEVYQRAIEEFRQQQ